VKLLSLIVEWQESSCHGQCQGLVSNWMRASIHLENMVNMCFRRVTNNSSPQRKFTGVMGWSLPFEMKACFTGNWSWNIYWFQYWAIVTTRIEAESLSPNHFWNQNRPELKTNLLTTFEIKIAQNWSQPKLWMLWQCRHLGSKIITWFM
jgi:hypothetical protein